LTFKDLKKKVSLEIAQQQSELSERLLNKPFWIWSTEEHKQADIRTNGDCYTPNSLPIEGKATCTIVKSTTTINCAKVMRANTMGSRDEEPDLVIVVG
jgi:hypothetical protein